MVGFSREGAVRSRVGLELRGVTRAAERDPARLADTRQDLLPPNVFQARQGRGGRQRGSVSVIISQGHF